MFLCELPETTFVVNCGWEPNDLVYTDNPKGDDPNEDGDNMEGLNAIDWGLVDFILISNYENMGLLPWISEYTSFQGDIFVTEPTKSYGKCLVEERILLSSLWSGHENAMPQIPSTSKVGGLSQSHTEIMKPPYTLHDVTQCFEKISDVRYNQVIKPLMTVSIHAQSSGYCIGSANWVVDYKGEKIAFISASSFAEQLHPQELDKSVVKNSSIVVVSDLDTRTDTSDTSKSFYWLGKIASNIVNTVKQKANTIVVSRPLGLVNDLLQMTAEMIRHRALVSPQYLFISPIASKTMQLGNIMGEWLNRSKQDALYIPEYPFIERELRLDNSLRYLKSVADLSITPLSPEPCVAFVSPNDGQSLKHLIRLWGSNSHNSIIFHDVNEGQALMNSLDIPNNLTLQPNEIDQRLDRNDVLRLIEQCDNLSHLLAPVVVCPFLRQSQRLPQGCVLHEYSHLSSLTLNINSDTHYSVLIKGKSVVDSVNLRLNQKIPIQGTIRYQGSHMLLETSETKTSGKIVPGTQGPCKELKIDPDTLVKLIKEAGASVQIVPSASGDPNKQIIKAAFDEGRVDVLVRSDSDQISITSSSISVQKRISKIISNIS